MMTKAEFLEELQKINPKYDLEFVGRAFVTGQTLHDGQLRKSGEPYIVHPLNVAMILTTIYADSETIEAALLHDVLEDCDCTHEEMEEIMGPTITRIVEGVTKLSKIHFSTENDYLIEVGSDGYFNCSNCSKEIQKELKGKKIFRTVFMGRFAIY
mgnify:CR=1 FL=1